MAPPSRSGPGYSKKAQRRLFTGYVVAVIGAVLGGALLAVSLYRPGTFGPLRGAATDAASPIGEAGEPLRRGTNNFADVVAAWWNAGRQNNDLRRENELNRIRLARARAVEAENVRLKALLGLARTDPRPIAVARLIGSTSASTRRLAYIGVGRDRGVQVGMPVRGPRGLVGRVLETGVSSARVLLLTDNESMVPVRRAGDDLVALAEGRGDGTIRLRLVNLGINPIRPGDVFLTSGAGGLYPPNIPVAMAMTINRDGAIARVLADPAASDYVVVEPIFVPAARAMANTPVGPAGQGGVPGVPAEAPASVPAPDPSIAPAQTASGQPSIGSGGAQGAAAAPAAPTGLPR